MKKLTKQMIRIVVALVLFVAVFAIDKVINLGAVWPSPYGWLFPFGLYLVIYLLIGYDVLWKAIRNLVRGQLLDENFLMMVATMGAFALAIYRGVNGQIIEGFDEACAVLLFYQVGEWFQKYATRRSRRSIAQLMAIRPDYANRVNGDNIEQVDPTVVKVDDIILINPGEKVPLDGVVIKGASSIDTKALTGEALPRAVAVNDIVISGCVNLTSQITVKVTKIFYDSTVAKILDLVENAAMKKAKSENFITKFARYYTPTVVVLALILAVVPGVVTGDWATWVYRALSFLVVSCPCALVISIPMSFFVALGTASRHGILIKGSNYLEQLYKANVFVFDKTGTLTKGNFAITRVEPVSRRTEILRLAAIAERDSRHPIAMAIVSAYGQRIPAGYTLTNVAGAGVIARNADTIIYCGNEKLLQQYHIAFTPLNVVGTVSYVAQNGTYVGAIVIQDEIKPETIGVLNDLRQQAISTVMMTGDNENVASSFAEQVGLSSYRASLLPQDKVDAVEELLAAKGKNDVLCFVGDGINDAPVLMRADVGVAMGVVGSDAAIEAADVVLMHDDLRGLLTAKKVAHKTMMIVKENIVFSIGVKLLILVLAALGIANMWLAVFGDVGVAILAILNALRVNLGYYKRRKEGLLNVRLANILNTNEKT